MNAAKTQAIIFPFNKSPKRKAKSHLVFDGEEIPFSKSVSYLGLDLDEKLTFGKQCKKAAENGSKCVRSLYPLLSKKSKLSNENKNILYKSVIRPVMMYGCPIWHRAASSHIKKIQIVQNKTLKIINKLPWRYSTRLLHRSAGYPTIKAFMKESTDKFERRCGQSDFPLIRQLIQS